MKDGTYYVDEEAGFFPVSISKGFWVAETEVSPTDLSQGEYLGVWTDTKENKTYYDKAHLILELSKAIVLAKRWNQLAIWDNENQKEIRISE